MDAPALERCVGDVEVFLERYWGRSPLFDQGAGPRFDDLASLDDLDRMVSSLGLRESALRMVKDGTTLPPSAYTTAPSSRSRAKDGAINAPLVYEQYEDGATIVLEGLHRYWEPLTDLCRDLETALGHRLQVNAYITPPGSQGFDVHRDEHDVFVLQIWGSKRWIVYDSSEDERVLIDETIEPGASLYIPAGFPHAATTGTAGSAHLTVGILTHDSTDILKEIVKLASEEPLFKERLTAPDVETLSNVVEEQIGEFRRWLDKVDVTEVTNLVARRVFTTGQPVLRGQLRQLELISSIDDTTTVRRRKGSSCRVSQDGEQLRILLSDRELAMPGAAGAAMQHIMDTEVFRVSELHGPLDPEGSLVLVRRLVRRGCSRSSLTTDEARCSDASELRAEPLYGTASFVRRWVLLEQPGSWGNDALSDSSLGKDVGLALKQMAWDAGVRLILIRRGVRFSGEGRRCYFARTDETSPYLAQMSLDRPEDLLDVDLMSMAEGGGVEGATPHEDPVFLVCTHGRHDACCSIRGNKVSRVACAEPGFDAWESSHIGGDRFAANLVCFPHGVYYGRVAPENVSELMDAYGSGDVSLENYRGRSCFTMAVQAAEYFVRRETGVLGIEDVRFVQSSRVDERLLDVTFRVSDGRYVDIRLALDETPESFRLTCGATRLNRIPRFDPVDITIR